MLTSRSRPCHDRRLRSAARRAAAAGGGEPRAGAPLRVARGLPARGRAAVHARLALRRRATRSCPSPGDYMTLRIAGEPIVIARDADGRAARLLQHVRPPRRRGGAGLRQRAGVQVPVPRLDLRPRRPADRRRLHEGRARASTLGAAAHAAAPARDVARQHLRQLRSRRRRRSPSTCAEFEKDFAFLRMEHCRLGNRIELDARRATGSSCTRT